MSGLTGALLSFLLLSRYWALFLIVLSSAIILPIPVNVILLATGAFASQGYFSFETCLIIALIANVLGDCLDFFLARIYGRKILDIFNVRIPSFLQNVELYIQKYPALTIITTRFGGITDPPVNFLSGLSTMPFYVFLLYDTIGNFLSGGTFLLVGYVLGVHWQDFVSFLTTLSWVLASIIIAAAIMVAIWYKNRRQH